MDLKLKSFNCRGLPRDRTKLLARRPDIESLFEDSDIIAFQETHYAKQNIQCLNALHPDFVGIGTAKVDECDGVMQGKYSGGVAILWRHALSKYVKQLDIGSDWCNGVEINLNNSMFVLLNVYLPYQCRENEDIYMENLGILKSLLDDIQCTNIAIIGDFNANLGITGTRLFTNYMLEFCEENSLLISSKLLLPYNSYTYISTRDNIEHHSWLDHVVSSLDFHSCIENITIDYDRADEDHIPISLSIKVDSLPDCSQSSNSISEKINWEFADEGSMNKYLNNTDTLLSKIDIPVDTICCNNLRCQNPIHHTRALKFYQDIIHNLSDSSTHMLKCSKKF